VVAGEELSPEGAGVGGEDGGGVAGSEGPVAAGDFAGELARSPARIAGVGAEGDLFGRFRQELPEGVSVPAHVEVGQYAGAVARRRLRTDQQQQLARVDGSAQIGGLAVAAGFLDLGQQLVEAHLDRAIHDQAERAGGVVIDEHDHCFREVPLDVRVGDQERSGVRRLECGREGRGRRVRQQPGDEQRQAAHPRWYSARKASRQAPKFPAWMEARASLTSRW
jgi:hypothetical protein